jgi:uncharacterized protein YgiM (DUF1202 family)
MRRIVPVALLVLVLVRAISIVDDYQDRVSGRDEASQETTGSVEATEAAGGAEGAADEQGSGDEQPDESSDESASPTRYVVVKIAGLNFRTAPESDSEVMRTLPEGTRLVLLGQQNGWYQVRDDDDVTGWVSSSSQYVEVVDE